jgi:hypothetical protein
LYSVLPQARGLRLQSSSWCTWLSHAPTPRPHPTPLKGIGVSYGSPHSYSPLPFACLEKSPVFARRTQTRCCRRRVVNGLFRALRLPSRGTGCDRFTCIPKRKARRRLCLGFPPSGTWLVFFDWQTSQARYVWVFIPRKARHASGRLALASLSQALLLGYLLSPHRAFQEHAAHVVEWPITLNSKGSWGTCIPQGVTTCLLRAFTAHRLNKQSLINVLAA